MKGLDQIRSEFDRIAESSTRLPDILGPHEASLLREVPRDASIALDLGCGTGALARRLASRCRHVVAIDMSPQMIRQARNRSAQIPNIEFHVSEVGEWLDAHGSYDCITAMAVFHHARVEEIVEKAVRAAPSRRSSVDHRRHHSPWLGQSAFERDRLGHCETADSDALANCAAGERARQGLANTAAVKRISPPQKLGRCSGISCRDRGCDIAFCGAIRSCGESPASHEGRFVFRNSR
jgi:SAM-dependent methyltransferase